MFLVKLIKKNNLNKSKNNKFTLWIKSKSPLNLPKVEVVSIPEVYPANRILIKGRAPEHTSYF